MLKSIKSFVHLNRRETLMNILVCDDNESFVLELTEKIHHSCICLGVNASITPFIHPKQISAMSQYDIAFLDVDMEEMTGISLAKILRQQTPNIVIIFVTNFIQYDRTEQIIASLQGLGTSPYRLYTNQEVIEHLKELQAAMARGVFEKTHAENLRDKDIMLHFKTLAEEYGLAQTDTYCRFETNMRELSYTIGTYIKGMCGERMARKSLKLLSLDKNIRILYNVQLEDEDVQAEYDAIVVAPYGLFVVEVKNWDGDITITPSGLLTKDEGKITYSLTDKMSIKEALLREYLQDQFPASFHTMLLLPTEKAHVQDDYQKIFVCCGGALSYEIQSFESPENAMTAEQVVAIAETICAHHKEQRTLCPVNCDEIIEDYAILMARIEKLAANFESLGEDRPEDGEHSETQKKTTAEADRKEPTAEEASVKRLYESVNWRSLAAQAAVVAVPAVAAAIYSHRRNIKLF